MNMGHATHKWTHWGRHKSIDRVRALHREVVYDDGRFHYEWKARGHMDVDVSLLTDWDYVAEGTRRSTGWKSRRHRRQWEHNVVERDKHDAHRRRKAIRRGEAIEPAV